MSYTLAVGSDGTATTAQVVWSVDGQTYRFRSDNNFISWITTLFTVADVVAGGGGGGLDLIYSDQIPPVAGGTGNLWAKYDVAGAVAGNIRGLGAVDFQQNRAGQTQVASGNFSTIGGGQRNTASGTYSAVAGGSDHTASGYGSFVGGGANNDATALYATIGGGIQNTASNDRTTVGGGTYNTASAPNATVGGGGGNTASGYGSVVGGGRGNGASGSYSFVGGGYVLSATGVSASVPGGYLCTASGNYSIAGGNGCNASGYNSSAFGGANNTASAYNSSVFGGLGAKADRYAMSAYAGGFFAVAGDAQAVSFVLRGTTAGASTVNLSLDNAGTFLTIPNNKLLSCIAQVSGFDTAGVETINYIRQILITNVAGVVTLVHQSNIGTNHRSNPALDITFSAGASYLDIACDGIAGVTMRWVAVVNGLEIGI